MGMFISDDKPIDNSYQMYDDDTIDDQAFSRCPLCGRGVYANVKTLTLWCKCGWEQDEKE